MSGLRPQMQFAEGEQATQTNLPDPGFFGHMYDSAAQALMDGPVSGVQDYFELRRLKADEEDALLGTQVLKNQYGVDSKEPMRRGAAQFIRNRNERRERGQAVVASGSGGVVRGASSFAASVLGSALDPVNLGSMFIPLGPLTKGGKTVFKGLAPGLKPAIGLRTGNRFVQKAAFGATEGAIGFVPVEAVVATAEIQLQSGYDFSDALTALAMDVTLGAGIQTSIEGVSALFGKGPDGSFGIPQEGADDMAMAAGADLLAGHFTVGPTRAQRMTEFHLNNVIERAGQTLEDQSGRKARRKLRNQAKRARRGIPERDPVAEAKKLGETPNVGDPPIPKPPELDVEPSPKNTDELQEIQGWVDELDQNTLPETLDALPPEVRLDLDTADAGLNAVRTLRNPENFKGLVNCLIRTNQTVIS